MSHAAIKAVIERSKATGAAWAVHMALAYHANRKDKAWPGVTLLSKETHLTERGVQKGIRELQRIGEIQVKYKGGPRGCNIYTLNLVRGEPRSQCTTFAETPNVVPGPPEPRSPKPSSKPSREPSSRRKPPRKKAVDPYRARGKEMVDHLHAEYGRIFDVTEDPLMESIPYAIGQAGNLLRKKYPEGPPDSLNGEKELLTWWLEHWNDGREGTQYERDDFSMQAFAAKYTTIKNEHRRRQDDRQKRARQDLW